LYFACFILVFQLINCYVKTDWKFFSYLYEALYIGSLVEKSEEMNTLLKNIPVTMLGAILVIDNNRFSVNLAFM